MRGSINAHFSSYGELSFGGMEHPDCRSVTIGQYADGYGDVTLLLTPAQIVQIRDHFTVLAADIPLTQNEAEVLEHAADNVRDSEPDIDDGFNAEAENEARVAPLDIDEVYF